MYESEFQTFRYHSPQDNYQDYCLYHQGTPGEVGILILHGHGSNGDQLLTRPDIASNWTPYLLKNGFSVIAPNLRDNAWMNNMAVADLDYLLTQLKPILQWKKLLVVSGSMGGTGGLIFAMRQPHWIHGVGVLGGATNLSAYLAWLEPQTQPTLQEIRQALRTAYPDEILQTQNSVCRHIETLTMPIYFVHGDADKIIPVEQARELRDLMLQQTNFHYQEIPGGGHDAPLAEFSNIVNKLVEKI